MELHLPTPEEVERFFNKVSKSHQDNCWIWTGYRDRGGYGRFGYRKKQRPAHRVSYWWHIGLYDETEREIDHLCRNRACVNPAHLELVTRRENILRGLCPTAINAQKTHCLRGHPLSGDNLYVFPNGGRCCKTCANLKKAEWRGNNYDKWIAQSRARDRRPDVKERRAAKFQRLLQTDGNTIRAKQREYQRAYRLRHLETVRARAREAARLYRLRKKASAQEDS